MSAPIYTLMSERASKSAKAPRRLIVKKFGGTSVANIERIKKVAQIALECQRAGNDVVLVVSAMSGETNRLLALAHQVVSIPDARELDAIAATGEQVSAALTAMAIHGEGGSARSFQGHQVKVHTDAAFTKARINTIDQTVLVEALAQGQIPVVAGFQGVDSDGNITTLGRGGSDTTGVALAAALQADECEIYTDVEGVYTADPNICPGARKMAFISFEEMLELASLGAKVLHTRSVEIAMKHNVPVHVRSTFSAEPGTWVVNKEQLLESRRVTGLACERRQSRVQYIGLENRPDLMVEVMGTLAELNVSVDMVSHAISPSDRTRADLAFSLSTVDLNRARPRLEELGTQLGTKALEVEGNLAKVSVVGIGIRSDPEVSARTCRTLVQKDIKLMSVAATELRVSCLIDEGSADASLRLLHSEFELEREPPQQSVLPQLAG